MDNFELNDQATQLADTRSAYSLARELLELQAARDQGDAKPVGHIWNDVGERCVRCGDKDWFAGAECDADRHPPAAKVPDGYAVVDSNNEFHFIIECGDCPSDSLFLCQEHINESENENTTGELPLEIKQVFIRSIPVPPRPQEGE